MMVRLTRRAALKAGLIGGPILLTGSALRARSSDVGAEAAGWAPYVDPTLLSKVPFGTHSHYIQPWRSYLDTVPAADFLASIGVVLNEGPRTPEAAIHALARNGFAHARLEISWSEFDFEDGRRLQNGEPFRRTLAACRAAGLRPLVLLNAHHGLPVPTIRFDATVIADAGVGDRAVRVSTNGRIVPGRTGLSDISEFWAAEIIVTGSSGDRLTLSKPLPKPFPAGTKLRLATLKFEPFAAVGSPRTETTLAGWVRYVDSVAAVVADALGTTDASDKGFDLEIWNELSFGSKFLSIDNYYDPPLEGSPADRIWAEIVSRTADWVAARPARFAGVRLENGFANTVPWPAAAEQPAAVTAIGKHPYPRHARFPRDEQKNTKCLDARGRTTEWSPRYEAFFPEYFATAIQTETIIRDMGPEITEIYGHRHGRNARRIADRVAPVTVWITEIGANPAEVGIDEPGAAQALKAKAIARALLFYANKGAERIYLYAATGSERDYGLVPSETGDRAERAAVPRAGDGPLSSPSLEAVRRIAAAMREGLSPTLSRRRRLDFRVRPYPQSAMQFSGDGTRENPPLRNGDMLALLPYQVNEHRFVIAYYFVTRDIRVAANPELMTLEVEGLNARELTSAVYDPLANAWSDASIDRAREGVVQTTLEVTDSPRLWMVSDRPAAASREH